MSKFSLFDDFPSFPLILLRASLISTSSGGGAEVGRFLLAAGEAAVGREAQGGAARGAQEQQRHRGQEGPSSLHSTV